VVYVVMTLVRFLPPTSFSGPFNPEQRAAAISIGLDMVAWMKAEMTWIFAGTTWLMVALAQGHSPDLLMWFVPPALVFVFATVIYHVARMVRPGRTQTNAR
jgi:glyoxylase-like metal-dependent hydrolase (beta-lactamase superfamily II)